MQGHGSHSAFTASNEANSHLLHDDACIVSRESSVGATPCGTDDACLVGGHLSDEVREAAIARAGASLERHMLLRENALFEYDVTGDFGAKAEADRHRHFAAEAMRLQAELIRGRSPEVVARMEQERGIA